MAQTLSPDTSLQKAASHSPGRGLRSRSKLPSPQQPRDESNGFLSSILSVAHNAANIIGTNKSARNSRVALDELNTDEQAPPALSVRSATLPERADAAKTRSPSPTIPENEVSSVLLPFNVHFLPVHELPINTMGEGDLLLHHFDLKKSLRPPSEALQVAVNAADVPAKLAVLGAQDQKVVHRKLISNGSVDIKRNSEDSLPLDEDDQSVVSENSGLDEILGSSTITTANAKKNREFHHTFRKIPATENLIDEFLCALSKDILVQGKMYLSHHYICFNSNILGWTTNTMIPLQEVIQIEKKSTAVLFPNGMIIRTLHHKYVFATFLSRDATFNLITKVWHNALQADSQDLPLKRGRSTGKRRPIKRLPTTDTENYAGSDSGDYLLDEIDDSSNSIENQEFSRHSSFKTKSGNNDTQQPSLDHEDSDNQESLKEKESENLSDAPEDSKKKKGDVQLFKGFPNPGPATHAPTEYEHTKEPNEVSVLSTTIKAPLGVLYDLLFGANNETWVGILEKMKNFDVEKDKITELSNSQKERNYTYVKPLGGPIGPKQTKCIITETLQHFDLSKYVEVQQITQTPDVPLGNSFKVKTKIFLSWGQSNSTNLNVVTLVEWSAKSWIKGPVEKGSTEGQKDFTKGMADYLTNLIASGGSGNGGSKKKRKKSKSVSEAAPPKEEIAAKEEPKVVTFSDQLVGILEATGKAMPVLIPMVGDVAMGVVVLLIVSLLYSYLLIWMLGDRNSISVSKHSSGHSKMIMLNNNKYQLLPTPDTYLSDELSRKLKEAQMWSWINSRSGGRLSLTGGSKELADQEFEEMVKLTKKRVDAIYKLLDV